MTGRPVRARWLEALFDVAVTSFELTGGGDEATLLPAEVALVEGAAPSRRAEFAAGRLCARSALGRLGMAEAPLLRTSDRAPAWPPDVTGSITHTGDYAAAVVHLRGLPDRPDHGRASLEVTVGLDAEKVGRVTPDLYALLFTLQERRWLAGVDPAQVAAEATAMFAAKEALYKAQHPWTGAWVDFTDVAVRRGRGLELVPAGTRPELSLWRWPVAARAGRSGDVLAVGVTLRRAQRA